jgi:hypothetical protein
VIYCRFMGNNNNAATQSVLGQFPLRARLECSELISAIIKRNQANVQCCTRAQI